MDLWFFPLPFFSAAALCNLRQVVCLLILLGLLLGLPDHHYLKTLLLVFRFARIKRFEGDAEYDKSMQRGSDK